MRRRSGLRSRPRRGSSSPSGTSAKGAVPVYFSTDTGASVSVNTTAEHADRVEARVGEHAPTRRWVVGGPAAILDGEAPF